MRRIVRAPVLGLSIQTGQTQLRENAPLSRLQSGQGRLLACYRPDRHILNGTAQQQTLTASPTNMAPKKRRAAAAGGAETHAAVNPDHLVVLNKRLEEIDAAVEERCEAIKAAADEAVAKIMQQLKMQLLQLPKKVRTMPCKEYEAAQQQASSEGAAGPSAAAARVDSKLEAAQQQSVAAATAAPTTRSLRSRARSATAGAAAAAEPRTTRSTRSRQAVVAAAPAPELDPVAPTAENDASGEPAALAQLQTLACVDSPAQPPPPAAAAASRPPAADEARRAAAQAKVDAKLAALGVAAAGTAARGADRTVLRQIKPGETFFSKNGSPLSIHPNVTRHRGRTMAAPLMTPAMQAAAPAGSSMLGCITLIKKQTAATGLAAAAAAATGRSKRSRAAVAAVPEEQDGDVTAIMVTTDDGSTFTVDAATGGVGGVPARYRDEVAAKLKAIQALAAAALGGAGSRA